MDWFLESEEGDKLWEDLLLVLHFCRLLSHKEDAGKKERHHVWVDSLFEQWWQDSLQADTLKHEEHKNNLVGMKNNLVGMKNNQICYKTVLNYISVQTSTYTLTHTHMQTNTEKYQTYTVKMQIKMHNRSSSSSFPTISVGFTIFGKIFAYVTVFFFLSNHHIPSLWMVHAGYVFVGGIHLSRT